ncbi:hypothetical protein D3C73_1112910 [compost metagenome]
MGLDAAIGNHQKSTIIRDGHVMRADAMSVEFADPPECTAAVIEADHAAIAVEIVFAGIKNGAVRREMPVAVEMPALRRGDDDRLRLSRRIEHHRKRAGSTGKGDGAARRGTESHAMRTGGQGHPVDDLAPFGNRGNAECALRGAITGGIDRIGPL